MLDRQRVLLAGHSQDWAVFVGVCVVGQEKLLTDDNLESFVSVYVVYVAVVFCSVERTLR